MRQSGIRPHLQIRYMHLLNSQNGRPDVRQNECKYGKIAYWLHSRDNES
jgi:hypothetical protein